ncbi:DUF3298 and DUF4163 domain-containing protein [Flavobacteriaceae bacterium TP-CH-4]|uniref:DUF3298 and DUF4163 domain-containing protein n=1 Tax=Pelagihabitans pacificus TaxID=2696054 RepID=A0A967E654_9FLAO|nr:DUF3298 and DUF4163 domain-containing protein [Pelagihabitans pacificus]NHF58819.1 DUF3298 and DUF4163 domain-containing protein [Pelagihabitans pacificus]
MKSSMTYVLLFLLLIGCKKTEKLTFEPLMVNENECAECTKVSIVVPKPLDRTRLANTINATLEEEIIALLSFDDEVEVTSMDEAIQSFSQGYQKMRDLFEDETTPWEAKIEGTITYEDTEHLTIEMNSYIFTGGAHGYSINQFLNFDKQKGRELENWELFKNQQDFEEFAETKFREQEAIPENASINHTGLMFERDSFYLPDNIGFTEQGIKLLYNPYEVASYSDGAISLVLPFEEVKPYLANRIKS